MAKNEDGNQKELSNWQKILLNPIPYLLLFCILMPIIDRVVPQKKKTVKTVREVKAVIEIMGKKDTVTATIKDLL